MARMVEVTRVLPDGRRHTLVIEAKSAFHAATIFYGSCVGSPGEKLPPFTRDTVLEVKPIFHIRHEDAMRWAAIEAQKQFKKK